MRRLRAVVLGIVGVTALAIVLGVCALRDRPPSQARIQAPEPVAASVRLSDAASSAASVAPASAQPSPVAVAPKPRKPSPTDAARPLDEAELLATINELGPSNLPLTVALAKEAVSRFPNSPKAPEFEMNIAKSLLHMGRIDEAREQARLMLKKYPGNPFTLEVEHHLLTNPPNPQK
jgi:hypothetical protein